MQRESSPSALIPSVFIFHLTFISISANCFIINPLKLLLKAHLHPALFQVFHHIREQPYAATHISNIKSKYISLNRITDILITTKVLIFSLTIQPALSTGSFSSCSTNSLFTCYISYTFVQSCHILIGRIMRPLTFLFLLNLSVVYQPHYFAPSCPDFHHYGY